MAEIIANRIRTTLNGAINNSVTSLTCTDASDFPATGDFRIRVGDSVTYELMKVTAVAGNVFTVVRAAEAIDGTQTAVAHANLVDIRLVLTAGALDAKFGGGGGATVGSGTYAGKPAAGNAGDLWLPTDEPFILRDDGSAWQSFGPVHPLKMVSPPATWFNQGTCSVVTTAHSEFMNAPDNGGSSSMNYRCREKAYPSTPVTVDAAFLIAGYMRDNVHVGIYTRDSGTGRMVVFGPRPDGMYVFKLNSESSYNSTQESAQVPQGLLGMLFLRFYDDGTNCLYSWSADGVNYIPFRTSQSRTFWLATPDKIGWFINNQTNFFQMGATLLHWYEH